MADITSGSSFEPNNPTEQKLGYVYECRVWKWPWEENLDPKEFNKFLARTVAYMYVHTVESMPLALHLGTSVPRQKPRCLFSRSYISNQKYD